MAGRRDHSVVVRVLPLAEDGAHDQLSAPVELRRTLTGKLAKHLIVTSYATPESQHSGVGASAGCHRVGHPLRV